MQRHQCIERELENLPPRLQEAIAEVGARLAEGLRSPIGPKFTDFNIDGEPHKAYFVPRRTRAGKPKFEFALLIY